MRDDQLREFRGDVDVGTFDRTDDETAGAVSVDRVGQRIARIGRRGERLSILSLQRIGRVKRDQRHLGNRPCLAVIVVHDNIAVGLRGDPGETAGRYAVLADALEVVSRSGILRDTTGATICSEAECNRLRSFAEIHGHCHGGRSSRGISGRVDTPRRRTDLANGSGSDRVAGERWSELHIGAADGGRLRIR